MTAKDGTRCALTEEDFAELNEYNYWHSRTDPSSWLVSSTVSRARARFEKILSRAQVIELCAQTLNIDSARVESLLDWNANYMAWHDGMSVEETHIWPQEQKDGKAK